MQTIRMLANEIPWVMAPAALIAAMLVIALIRAVVQVTENSLKVLALSVLLALTGGMSLVLFLN